MEKLLHRWFIYTPWTLCLLIPQEPLTFRRGPSKSSSMAASLTTTPKRVATSTAITPRTSRTWAGAAWEMLASGSSSSSSTCATLSASRSFLANISRPPTSSPFLTLNCRPLTSENCFSTFIWLGEWGIFSPRNCKIWFDCLKYSVFQKCWHHVKALILAIFDIVLIVHE